MRRGTRGRGYGGSGRQQAPYRPQNNIPRLLQPQQNTVQEHNMSPFTTNHLQGLKDIDMELELLKRKREIIEQQQQILTSSYRQRNDYEQPVHSQARESRYDNYTRLYDNPREHDQYGGGGGRSDGGGDYGGRNDGGGGRGGRNDGSRKRPHIPVWDHEAPAKRFSAPARGAKKSFGPRLGPAPNQPPKIQRPPEARFAAPKPYKAASKPPQKKKEFNPTKVSKPTPAPLMKLATYQPAERKRLVTEAVASGTTRPAADDAMILRADREPSHLMVGRMELALGAIMKEIKTANPQHENLFKQTQVLRVMKQCVRDQLRIAMIGKSVSGTDQIKLAYYDMFPFSSDNEVVMKGLMVYENKKFVYADAADPEVYFKRNMRNLMSLKMEEMVGQLQEIYKGGALVKPLVFTPHARHRNYKGKPYQKGKPKTDTNESSKDEAKPNTESDMNETQNKDNVQPDANETQNKDNVQPDANESHNEDNDQAKVNVTQSEDVQPKTEGETEIAETAETVPKEGDNETKPDVTVESVKEEANASTAEAQAEITDNQPEKPAANKLVVPKELIDNEKYMALDNILTYKMLHLIRRYTPEFVKNMELDAMYRKTKAAIISETAKKMGKNTRGVPAFKEDLPDPTDAQNEAPNKTPEKRVSQLHYVKILGKPSLPKRKAMEHFFNNYKPKSIKKHRTIHNLLFVGFVEKESYEAILAADGTTIGRFTLDIKVSERNDNKKNQNNAGEIPTSAKADKLDESIDSILGNDLDNQITDLLTSIRKSEEFDNFAEDIVMAEPVTDQTKTNEDQTTKEIIDCDADQNANNVASRNDVVEIQDENDDEDVVEIKDVPKNDENDVVEVNDGAQNDDVEVPNGNDQAIEDQSEADNEVKITENENDEKTDAVGALKNEKGAKATPTRVSARLATPGGIKTRRMSKLE